MQVTRAAAVDALRELAPLELAAEWDNVGLLLNPGASVEEARAAPARKLFLTIDLTEAVLDEAIEWNAELIVAYHPVIFKPLSRLDGSERSQRLVLRALAHGIAVYSPHTALDAVPGGINDWLASALGPASEVRPIEACRPSVQPEQVASKAQPGTQAGLGRWVTLQHPISVAQLLRNIAAHLGLRNLRVALSAEHASDAKSVQEIALCPGAGGSLLKAAPGADVYWTGEMRHHDVLDLRERGASVILSEHTLTERGYLPELAQHLRSRLPSSDIWISERDADPLAIVSGSNEF